MRRRSLLWWVRWLYGIHVPTACMLSRDCPGCVRERLALPEGENDD